MASGALTLIRSHGARRLAGRVVAIAERFGVARHASRPQLSVEVFEPVGDPVVSLKRCSDRKLQLSHRLLGAGVRFDEDGVAVYEPEHVIPVSAAQSPTTSVGATEADSVFSRSCARRAKRISGLLRSVVADDDLPGRDVHRTIVPADLATTSSLPRSSR